VRPSFGIILIPLFEEDGLRLGELAQRAKISKQTMTTMIRLVEKEAFVTTRADPDDGRATRVYLTDKARRFKPVAERVLAELEGLATRVEGRESLDQVKVWLRSFVGL
jgi:MarR family transcriptional regulator, organic hydroperoxide resistance regulator